MVPLLDFSDGARLGATATRKALLLARTFWEEISAPFPATQLRFGSGKPPSLARARRAVPAAWECRVWVGWEWDAAEWAAA